jgi:hypothetical protein
MDKLTAYTLLKSLLQRLDADSLLEQPRMSGLVSATEKQALEQVLKEYESSLAVDALRDGAQLETVQAKKGDTQGENPKPDSGESTKPESAPLAIDEKAFSFAKVQNPEIVLCLDFGTAKSKAFAASDDESDPKFYELALGKRDGDQDGSIYAVSSSVWIEENGQMYAGSEAVRRGANQTNGVKARRRLDSLKQELSQVLPGHQVGSQILPPEVNPSGIELSYDDAITFYLAYLTDLAVSELNERHGISRYVRRRFTLPCWESEHRSRAAQLLSRRLACAQVLADSFHNRWKDGIPAKEVKRLIQSILSRVDKLTYLLDLKLEGPKHLSARWGGLLEPLAAGSSRIWLDRSARDLVLVVDVGAGTTDLSVFWVVQTSGQKGHRAFPVEPCGTAIRMAGDLLDSVLVRMILDRAHLGADTMLQQRVSSALFLSGVRRLKEQLINTGELTHRLVNDQVISITRKEFLETEGVRNFTTSLEKTIETFLSSIDLTWHDPMSKIRLVLTGGGCDLPMVRAIAEREWHIGGQKIRFQQTKNLPELIAERFDEDFCREYPQLAVALGGALPMVLDEGNSQKEWFGGAQAPGPLPRYPVTGT